MKKNYFSIDGVLPPLITPFSSDGRVDFAAFERNIDIMNGAGLAGYLVLGSNGETPYIDDADKPQLVRRTAARAKSGMIIMAGTGLESTSATIELTRRCADAGAQCALVLTPNYYNEQMGDDAQIAYFSAVADASPIPVLIYNVTKFTHINISPAAVSKLSRHENIIGMKDSSGNIAQLISYMVSGLDPQFNLMVGTASAWYPALAIGVKGAVMALANCCPRECVEVQTLYNAGKLNESLELYKRMFPVNACVTGKLGVPALKYACDLLGFSGGESKRPLLPLSDAQRGQVAAILKTASLM